MAAAPRILALSLVFWLAPAPASWAEALEYETQRFVFDGVEREVRVPRGLVFEVLTTGLEHPRMLTFAANGDLLLGSRSGFVYRLPPPYTEPEVLVRLDDTPHSVVLRDGELLIGRTHGLYRAPYTLGQATIRPEDVTLLAALPGEGPHHMTRTLGVGPDGRVYVSLGMTGNCGDNFLDASTPFERRRGGLFVLREEGGEPRFEPWAAGLRNPVGFDWQPGTGVMYATNNGPDHWGYEHPREYFSRVTEGSFHGMPWFQFIDGKLTRDSCIKSEPPKPVEEVRTPVVTFAAHQAPVGVAFASEGDLDERLTGDAIVALHGSWVRVETPADRRKPKLVAVRFEAGTAARVDEFVTGFQLEDGKRWARPAGVAFGPDGALYVTSDRKPGALFRLRRASAHETQAPRE